MPTRPAVLTQRYIFRFWLPLALMWLMMAVEQPLLAGVIARLEEPKLNLAAFGITFSLALLIESPIIMLLVASTALAKGRQSYQQLLRFTTILSVAITILHLSISLTPAYSWIVGTLIGAPSELVEPSRQAFLVMFPWSAAVAYRRLWQGVMIRYGKTDQVGLTTAIRLSVSGVVAIVGLVSGLLPGATIAGLSLSIGVIAGALAAYRWAQPEIRGPLRLWEAEEDQISLRFLIDFYVPLALTNVINFIGRPLLTFSLSRAILPLESLALWPVLMSLTFLFQSVGFAYQEVVVALLDNDLSFWALRRFAFLMAAITSAIMLLIGATPLNEIWYGQISALSPDLVALSRIPTLLIALAPAASFVIAWQRGVLVNLRRTRPITLAVSLNVTVLLAGMWFGMQWFSIAGIDIAAGAFMLALLSEVAFLSFQTRHADQKFTKVEVAPA